MLRSTLTKPAGVLAVALMVAACAGGATPTSKPPTGAPPATPSTAASTSTAVSTATLAPVATAAATNTPTPTATPAANPTPTTAATTPAATQAGPADTESGRIAFGVRSGAGSEIFSMFPDGSDMKQLSTDTGNHLCASYTGDATQINYCGDGGGAFEIWTMNADGTAPTQLTNLGGEAYFPDASHDGKKVVFAGVQGDSETHEIYAVDASTGEGLVQLTNCEGLAAGCYNDYPAWSPDDKQIVYIHADAIVNDVAVNAQVWVMNADGSKPHALTSDSLLKDQLPNWSPDGTSIVYASGEGVAEGIWVMKSDGSEQQQLSGCMPSDELPCAAGEDFGPVWSPDGSRIAFLRTFQNLGTEDRPVFVMNADGSDQHRVIQDTILAAVPSWR